MNKAKLCGGHRRLRSSKQVILSSVSEGDWQGRSIAKCLMNTEAVSLNTVSSAHLHSINLSYLSRETWDSSPFCVRTCMLHQVLVLGPFLPYPQYNNLLSCNKQTKPQAKVLCDCSVQKKLCSSWSPGSRRQMWIPLAICPDLNVNMEMGVIACTLCLCPHLQFPDFSYWN